MSAFLTGPEFVERTKVARKYSNLVWLAYALGTLENVDTGWPELEAEVGRLSIEALEAMDKRRLAA